MIAARRLVLVIVSIGFCLSAAADERSDCAAFAEELELDVCRVPVVRPVYDALKTVLARTEGVLSEKGRAQLAAGQQSWRRRTMNTCDRADAAACLVKELGKRIDRIRTMYRRIGPYQFSAVEYHADIYDDDDDFVLRDGATHHRVDVAYPQIDTPATPQTERWNAAIAEWAANAKERQVRRLQDHSDAIVLIGGVVIYAEDGFISLARGVNRSGPAGRDDRDLGYLNLWLESGEALQPADLFNPASRWQATLRAFVRYRVEDLLPSGARRKQAELDALDPDNWSIGPDALTIQVNDPRRRSKLTAVVIPWRSLREVLVPQPPLALNWN